MFSTKRQKAGNCWHTCTLEQSGGLNLMRGRQNITININNKTKDTGAGPEGTNALRPDPLEWILLSRPSLYDFPFIFPILFSLPAEIHIRT